LIIEEPNKRTLLQIKNIGAFSLIANKTCRDAITYYDHYNGDEIEINSGYLKRLLEADYNLSCSF
jgi:hypothetical protein